MANEQTSVPLYAALEVLTAANMNISAGTGVPVFATTVTRDAAFGGASEKVLAEGQLCYLSSTNKVQYYDGAAWASVNGGNSQVVQTTKLDTFTTASTSYTDITGMSVSITPTSATSTVLVLIDLKITASSDNANMTLVRGSTEIYRGAAAGSRTRATYGSNTFNAYALPQSGGVFLDSPATTNATTYKLQMSVSSGTGYINRNPTDTDATAYPRTASSITVMEIII